MADRRRHRGAHPKDAELFAAAAWPALRTATAELSWLLARGYSVVGAIALVGDRHSLTSRQRRAVQRSACTDDERTSRMARRVKLDQLRGRTVMLDGFNCIIAIEAVLSGGVILRGRDGVIRDMASVHGSYRRVEETERAIELIAATLCAGHIAEARFWLDRPVSNSGRLAALIRDRFGAVLPIEVELVNNPDQCLIDHGAPHVVCSGDSLILDGCGDWLDLPAAVIEDHRLETWCVDMGEALAE